MVNRFNRRKSVFAESYDPEGDDDDDESYKQAVYPKSDQQRHRLAETVKNILLFRSLDPVSCCRRGRRTMKLLAEINEK